MSIVRVILRSTVGLAVAGMLCGAVHANSAGAPTARPSSFTWFARKNPRTWRLDLGSTQIKVFRSAKRAGAQKEHLPVVEISSAGAQPVRFVAKEWGDVGDDGITFRTDRLDPAHSGMDVLVAWYTGGAHCCTRVKIASLIGRQWGLIDLDEWNTEPDEFPLPRRGPDGVAVLPLWDEDFNYAFASYAFSGVPLKLLRVDRGKIVNVSADPQYRPWILEDMAQWQTLCTDPKQDERNGFCAAYAADAAHAGQLDQAWPVVMQNAQDEKQSFCRTYSRGHCQDAVKFEHYADALRWFLQQRGYVRR